MSPTIAPAPVLYAEDDDNDAFLMQRAFQKAAVKNPLRVVTNGEEAVRSLAAATRPAAEPNSLPRLVLLDLNLPRLNGLEVLKWIREQPALKELLVVILTSSTQERDIRAAYALEANGYLVKPPSSTQLVELVGALRDACLAPADTPTGWLDFKGNVPPTARATA